MAYVERRIGGVREHEDDRRVVYLDKDTMQHLGVYTRTAKMAFLFESPGVVEGRKVRLDLDRPNLESKSTLAYVGYGSPELDNTGQCHVNMPLAKYFGLEETELTHPGVPLTITTFR